MLDIVTCLKPIATLILITIFVSLKHNSDRLVIQFSFQIILEKIVFLELQTLEVV